MEVKSKIHQLFPVSKSRNAQNETGQPTVYHSTLSLDKKGDSTQRYTFYQSNQPYKYTPIMNNQPDKKQYKFVAQHLEDVRRKAQSQLVPNVKQNISFKESKNVQLPTSQPKTFSPFKKIQRTYQSQPGTLQFSQKDRYLKKSSTVVGITKAQPTEFPKLESTLMVQSTIIRKGSQIMENQTSKQSLFDSKQNVRLCQSNVEQVYSNDISSSKASQDPFNLQQKLIKLEKQCKILEKRNFELAQQMVSSLSAIKKYERSNLQLQETNKKHEQSLKISRNIITSLNQKIIKLQKESQNNITTIKEEYEQRIVDIQHTKQQQVKNAQAAVFQLNLKIIDLNHERQKCVSKKEKEIRQSSEKEINDLKKQNMEKIAILEDKQHQMNEDLMKIDDQNIRLDQQNQMLFNKINQLSGKFILQTQSTQELLEEKDTKIAQLHINITNLQLELLQQKQKVKNFHSSEKQRNVKVKQYQQEILSLKQNILNLQEKIKEMDNEKQQMRQNQKIEEKMEEEQLVNQNNENKEINLEDTQKREDEEQQNKQAQRCEYCLQKQQELSNAQLQILQLTDQIRNYIDQDITISNIQKHNKLLQQQLKQYISISQNLLKEVELKDQIIKVDKEERQTEISNLKKTIQKLQQQKQEVKDYIEEIHKVYKDQVDCSPDKQLLMDKQINPRENYFSPVKSNLSDISDFRTPNNKSSASQMQIWMRDINNHERQELVLKIHELYFMNKSLSLKMEDINEIEENENEVIMQKIKVFEQCIQKYQQDISQLQQQNKLQQIHINELEHQCRMQEDRIQWVNHIYQELEVNLVQSNQELIKTHAQLVSFRLSSDRQDVYSEQQSIHQLQKIIEEVKQLQEEPQKQDDYEQKCLEQDRQEEVEVKYYVEVHEVESDDSETEKDEEEYQIQVHQVNSEDSETENVDVQSKINRQIFEGDSEIITQLDVISASSPSSDKQPKEFIEQEQEENQVPIMNKMKQEAPIMDTEEIGQLVLQQLLMQQEYQYQVEDTAEKIANYAILVSHIDSDEQQLQTTFKEDKQIQLDESSQQQIKLQQEQQQQRQQQQIQVQQQTEVNSQQLNQKVNNSQIFEQKVNNSQTFEQKAEQSIN